MIMHLLSLCIVKNPLKNSYVSVKKIAALGLQVIGRKVNPDASYVEIEKPSWRKNLETKVHEAGLPQETDFSRLLGKEERSGTSQQSSTVIGKGKAAKATTTSDLPSLAPPPSRSTTMGTSTTTTTQGTAVKSGLGESAPTPHTKSAAVPMVTFGPGGYTATQGRKVKESELDDSNYMGLVRKPKLSSQDSYKPSWPTTKIIPPMMLHKVDQYDTVDSSGGGSNDDALLRRPTAVLDHNVSSTSKPSSEISSKMKNVSLKLASVAPLRKPSVGLPATGVGSMMSPPVIEEEGRVQGSEMSEERFTRLLELASSPNDNRDQEQQVSVAAKVLTRKEKNLPILGSKPLPLSPSHVEGESKDAAADQISRVDKRVGTHLLITTESASMEVESLSQSIDLDVLESGDKRRREPTAATAATSVVEASLPWTTTSKRPLPSSSLDQIHVSSPISSSVDNTVAEQDITPLQSSMSSPSVTAKHVSTSPSVSANMVSEEVVVAPLKKAAADSLVLNSVPEVTVLSAKEEKGREPTVSLLGMQAIMPITAPPTPVLAQKPFVRRPTATTAVPGDAVLKFTPPSEADSSSSPSLGQPEIIVSQEETRSRETTFGQSLKEEEQEESQVIKQPMPTTTLAQKPISRRPSFVGMDAKPELQASSGSLKRPILQLRTKKDNPIAPPATPAAAAAAAPPPPSTGVFESELSREEERLPDQMMISDEVDEKLNLLTSVTVVPKNAIGDKAVVADKDRLAGWSDEVKAAVRRSEVALVKEERRTSSSELNLKHLGQEDKSE
jgi:hypothetical protein